MEQSQLQAVWAQILDSMKEQLAPSAFNWLNPIQPLSLSDSELVLGTQTEMAKEWIAGHYQTFIEDAVSEVLGAQKNITFTVVAEETPAETTPVVASSRSKKDNPNQGSLFSEAITALKLQLKLILSPQAIIHHSILNIHLILS